MLTQARLNQNCIGLAYLYPSAYISMYTGLGACFPRKFLLNLMLWDGFWGYFGVPKHLCFSSGMVTGFWFSSMVCMHGDKCRVFSSDVVLVGGPWKKHWISVHWRFQTPWERREGVTHASQLEFCLLFILIVFQASSAENVWPPRSKSARSQVSTALFHVLTMTFVHGSVQDLYAGFSPASKGSAMLSQSKHWSGSRRGYESFILTSVSLRVFANALQSCSKELSCF